MRAIKVTLRREMNKKSKNAGLLFIFCWGDDEKWSIDPTILHKKSFKCEGFDAVID